MTAEIALMNKEAVVLAADSAVTFRFGGAQKVSPFANKIFALSRYNPVGIMSYGSARFMDIPWETIIKIYRNRLPKDGFSELSDYSNDFLSFINKENLRLSDPDEEGYIGSFVFNALRPVVREIREKMEEILERDEVLDDQVVEQIASEVITERFQLSQKIWKQNEPLIPKRLSSNVMRKYGSIVGDTIDVFLQNVNLSQETIKQLRRTILNIFPSTMLQELKSGIVIAGFGKEELFPSIKNIELEGLIGGALKCAIIKEEKIDIDNYSSIMAFAQRDMVARFMNGVDPLYQNAEVDSVSELCKIYMGKILDALDRYSEDEKKALKKALSSMGNKLIKNYFDGVTKFIVEQYNLPIINAVSVLPKDELVALAEALVNLTSIKRRFSEEEETVAGPIDIAVISKGDGFIWIKRKHYFQSELNPDFFLRHNKELLDGGQEKKEPNI